MKKLLSVMFVTVLLVSFVIGAVVQSKPSAGICTLMCNKTTYRMIECCTYVMPNGGEKTTCKMIGWCYPE